MSAATPPPPPAAAAAASKPDENKKANDASDAPPAAAAAAGASPFGEKFAHGPGRMVWFHLRMPAGDKVATVAKFYADVLGVNVMPMPEKGEGGKPSPHTQIFSSKVGSKFMASITPIAEADAVADLPSSVWVPELQVDSLEDTLKAATAAGGTALVKPTLIGAQTGSYASFLDPSGVPVGLFQSTANSKNPHHVRPNEYTPDTFGGVTWVERVCSDRSDKAKKFYTDVFGYSFSPLNMDGEEADLVVRTPKADDAEPESKKPHMVGSWSDFNKEYYTTNGWMLWFEVEDVDAASLLVKKHGGGVIKEPANLEPGRVCWCTDPAGAQFGLWHSKERPASMGGEKKESGDAMEVEASGPEDVTGKKHPRDEKAAANGDSNGKAEDKEDAESPRKKRRQE